MRAQAWHRSWLQQQMPLLPLLPLLLLLLLQICEQAVANKLSCHQVRQNGEMVAVCEKRKFKDIPTLSSPPAIAVLRLGENQISNLHDNSFTQYVNLKKLEIDSNILEKISNNTFQPLRKLTYLDISKNYLEIEHNAFLRPLSQLRTLLMGGNTVKLTKNFFYPVRMTITNISLETSKSLVIHEGAFNGLHKLENLNLNTCKLKTLSNEMGKMQRDFNSMSLRSLNLGDNPWECDCKLRWLPAWFKEQQRSNQIAFLGNPMCAGPEGQLGSAFRGMRNVKLFDSTTPATRFQCQPRVFKDHAPTQHRVREGDNVTLKCKFSSDPKGDARWLYGDKTATTVLPHTQRYLVSQEQGKTNFEAQLKILNVKAKDSRVYRCEVSNERGTASLQHRVSVDTSRSAMFNKRMVIIACIGVVIVITCTLMIGGVFFFHYTRSSSRSGSRKAAAAAAGAFQQQPPAGGGPYYSQLQCQDPRINGYGTQDTKKRVLAVSDAAAVEQQAVPLTAEVTLDPELRLQGGYLPTRSPAARQHSHQPHHHAPGTECPVHGSRQLFTGCPVHGAQESRAATPQLGGTLPLLGSNRQGPKPCPLHGDLYATIAKTPSHQAEPSSATMVRSRTQQPRAQPLPQQQLQQQPQQQLQQQPQQSQQPLVQQPLQHRQQQLQQAGSQQAAGAGTYVRASKVDDCISIPEGSDLPPPPPPEPLRHLPPAGHKPNPQDDEGYSTAV